MIALLGTNLTAAAIRVWRHQAALACTIRMPTLRVGRAIHFARAILPIFVKTNPTAASFRILSTLETCCGEESRPVGLWNAQLRKKLLPTESTRCWIVVRSGVGVAWVREQMPHHPRHVALAFGPPTAARIPQLHPIGLAVTIRVQQAQLIVPGEMIGLEIAPSGNATINATKTRKLHRQVRDR